MERDSSKHSEFSSSASENEDTDSETDKKKKKKSQPDEVGVWSRINSEENKSSDNKPKTAEKLGSLWHHETEKAESTESKDSESEQESFEDNQLEHLSQSEIKEVSEAYLTARRQEIAKELTELPDDSEQPNEAQAALAADTYLATVEDKLNTDPGADINDVTDEAYAEAVQNFAPESSIPEASNSIPYDETKETEPDDDGSQPPTGRTRSFPPSGFPTFGHSSANTSGNLETVIERDFAAERVAAVRGLLVGGIIGYLIGRRRGRIKTEKRLIPIQKKLESEVQSLYSTISIKENQLRTLVKQHDRSERFNRVAGVTNETQSPYSNNRNETRAEALNVPKTNSAETIKPPSSSIEIVNHENLLKAGEKITIGSTTLRKVFETGLISERGLRRAVEEYSKGGDIRRVLAEEVLIKELGYELDPILRDRPLIKPLDSSARPIAPQTAPHAQAEATIQGRAPAAGNGTDNPYPLPLPASQRNVPSLLITANVLALIVLAILVVILIVIHK